MRSKDRFRWRQVVTQSTRRQALAGLGAVGASFGLSACTLPISPFCPGNPIISDPDTPLTIDVHAHVFNGSDLQVDGFISQILALDKPELKALGPILRELGRDFAPTAKEELGELQKLASAFLACDNRAATRIIEVYKDASYRKAVIELKVALRRAQARRTFATQSGAAEIARQIRALPKNRSDYKVARRRKLQQTPESITASGGIDFIIRNFQYRYVNVHDYLVEYSIGKERENRLDRCSFSRFRLANWEGRFHAYSVRRPDYRDGANCAVDERSSALLCAV